MRAAAYGVPLMTATITLEGTGSQRGEAHGEALRDLIGEAAQRWQRQAGTRAEEQLAVLVDRSGFRQAAQHYAPDLHDEVEGIANGSGVDARRIWALNLLDEDWWIRESLASTEACSGFGVDRSGAQAALIAQNMDLPQWLNGLQVLLDIRPAHGPRVLAPTYAGMLATNVLNEHGVGVCVNTLTELPTDLRGVPVAFLIRQMANQPDLEGAIAVLRGQPHASGQNYLIGTPQGIADFECGSGTMNECPATGGRVAHTNHALGIESGKQINPTLANSSERLDALGERLAAWPAQLGPAEASAILLDPPLCRGTDGDRGFTFYSVIMELGPDPTLYLTGGSPDLHPYQKFSF